MAMDKCIFYSCAEIYFKNHATSHISSHYNGWLLVMLADVLPVALCPDAVEMLCDNILPFILCMEDDDSQAIILIF
jgi:hypothetical protein